MVDDFKSDARVDNNHDKTQKKEDDETIHVVFIHLDLGIGGAEQLVLQLATASQDLHYKVDIVTTRCDQDHCFESVKKQSTNGRLANNVHVYGRWIPPNIFGIATAFMSTLRMIYITFMVILLKKHNTADVIVIDVLPTSIPFLVSLLPNKSKRKTGILFYCHFPDKLLLRTQGGMIKKFYRTILDALEEYTMGLADMLVVNSKFTLQQVKESFPTLCTTTTSTTDQSQKPRTMKVLYPALDTSTMIQSNQKEKSSTLSPIVSLNRYERKKNIQLLLHAYDYIITTYPNLTDKLPKFIIAGGYDIKNVENVEYRGELQQIVNQIQEKHKNNNNDNNNTNILNHIEFRMDISDTERAILFQTALCVVYTPDREHFGIVPLEAMYAGTPVIAVNSGGPKETIQNNVTGYLKPSTSKDFGEAIVSYINNPKVATSMGQAGKVHVENTFGTKRFTNEWEILIHETIKERREKMNSTSSSSTTTTNLILWVNVFIYFMEAFIAFMVCIVITYLLRAMGILNSSQSILGAIKTNIFGMGDEL